MKIKTSKNESIYVSLKNQVYVKSENAINKSKSGIELFHHYDENSYYAVVKDISKLDKMDDEGKLIYLNSIESVLDVLQSVVKFEFKKHPLIGNLIYKIAEFNSKKLSYTTGLSILGRSIEKKDFLTNRDNLRHITNSGYDFKVMTEKLNGVLNDQVLMKKEEKTGLFPPKTFEILYDDLNLLIHNQKSKKMIQKIYGNKYKELILNSAGEIDSKAIDTYRIFSEKDISLSEIKHNFAKKLARFKSKEEHSIALNNYMNEIMGWSKNSILKKAKNIGATLHAEKDNIICLKIHNYKQSKELGSGQWCLSYDEGYFKDYKGSENALYFTFDFSLDQGDKKSMLGTVLDFECQIVNQHWRDDSIVADWNEEDQYDIKKHEELFPRGFSEDEKNENIFDSLNMKTDKSDYTTSLLSRIREMKDLSLLEKGVESELFDREFNSNYGNYFSKMYGFTLHSNRDKPEDILEKKIFKQGIKNVLESLVSFHIPDYGDNFFNDLLVNKEMEIIKILLKKSTEGSDFLSVIANTVNYTEKESLSLIEELIEIKKNRVLPMFNEKRLSDVLFSASLMNNSVMSVANKYIELNNGKINISRQIEKYCEEKPKDEFLIAFDDKNTDFLIKIIDSVQKKEVVKSKKIIQKHVNKDKMDKSDIFCKRVQSKTPLMNKI